MKIGIFGGSFDPVHNEHVRFAQAAIAQLGLEKLFVVPSKVAPHKRFGATASGADRAELCQIAFSDLPEAEISDFELKSEGTSYSYLTCRHFAERYPRAERFFLVGEDMLEDFFTWKNPDEILKTVTLVACGRGAAIPQSLRDRFYSRFGREFLSIDHIGDPVSSTKLRVELAFGKSPKTIPEAVGAKIKERALYSEPKILSALQLETTERREHSFRVALMACERAKSLLIPFGKALFAAALHDCGKSVPLNAPMLKDFVPPAAPDPVMHQYVGAYLAETVFQIEDADILNAIRFHTSGRPGMSELEKLIFLSDALEEGRAYEGVERLRELFWRDLDGCLCAFFKEQLEYLEKTGKRVDALTRTAYDWIRQKIGETQADANSNA